MIVRIVQPGAPQSEGCRRACDVVDCAAFGGCDIAPADGTSRDRGTADEWFRVCRHACVALLGGYVNELRARDDAAQLRLEMGDGTACG